MSVANIELFFKKIQTASNKAADVLIAVQKKEYTKVKKKTKETPSE